MEGSYELKPQIIIEPVLNARYDRSKMAAKFRELVSALNKANTNVEYDLAISDDDIYSLTMSYRTTTKENKMHVQKFRKKPVVIEAMRLEGSTAQIHTVFKWVERNTLGSFEPLAVIEGREPYPESGVSIDPRDGRLIISTLEGLHWANPGDWIIRGVAGEFYPCRDDIFRQTYELVDSDDRLNQIKEENTMTRNTEDDLNTLLDGLTQGDRVKATWAFDNYTTTVEGPVTTNVSGVWCDLRIRLEDRYINPYLVSLEVIRDEEVTVARDDEKVTATRDDERVLHELLDSLENGDVVTSEWGNENGKMTLTGTVRTDCAYLEVRGYYVLVLRQHTGVLNKNLRSVTVRRTVVQHWERECDE